MLSYIPMLNNLSKKKLNKNESELKEKYIKELAYNDSKKLLSDMKKKYDYDNVIPTYHELMNPEHIDQYFNYYCLEHSKSFTVKDAKFFTIILSSETTITIFNLVEHDIPVDAIKILAAKIDVYALNKRHETPLFKINSPSYLLSCLNLDINVNVLNIDDVTFLYNFVSTQNCDHASLLKILYSLDLKKFKFNEGINKQLILSAFKNKITPNIYKTLILFTPFDVTNDTFWLKEAVDKSIPFANLILQRQDVDSFLNKLLDKYNVCDFEPLLCQIVNAFRGHPKVKNMITYKDHNGDTVLHKLAILKYTKLLRDLLHIYNDVHVGENRQGKTIEDLLCINAM